MKTNTSLEHLATLPLCAQKASTVGEDSVLQPCRELLHISYCYPVLATWLQRPRWGFTGLLFYTYVPTPTDR